MLSEKAHNDNYRRYSGNEINNQLLIEPSRFRECNPPIHLIESTLIRLQREETFEVLLLIFQNPLIIMQTLFF